MSHEHKFNATLIGSMGRCACGAWAHYRRMSKCYGDPIQHEPSIKGYETRLRRLKDPNYEDTVYPSLTQKEAEHIDFPDCAKPKDLTKIYKDTDGQ